MLPAGSPRKIRSATAVLRLRDLLDRDERAADDAMAEIAVHIAEDGGVRDGVKARQALVVLLRRAARIDADGRVVDGGARRQHGDALHHLVE